MSKLDKNEAIRTFSPQLKGGSQTNLGNDRFGFV